ncbi:hypothetical protein PV05_11347 [Exophiala xenobiotica]|uniref:Enoyl reductase (ER) domain-containing protein n=1 Tax=Exophiala xenobiotica TaxID=348802 RepID=A0A0D2E2H7_9EURO|nr:uncharacterized protein PV05_11347 [Exophiala xenobiotica]KIW49693.1 hypothetical protein PV05_11347 [Exophiala xenobiotica]
MAAPSTQSIPSVMRAWQYSSTHGGLERNLVLNESAALPPHDDKALGKDKVLVQVLAASLNPVDYKFVELPLVGRMAVKTPACPGLDFAGRVVKPAPGTATSEFPVGQLVFGRLAHPTSFGTLEDYTVVQTGQMAKIPTRVSVQDAACVGTAGLTAYECIVPNVKGGDKIFINGGSGGTGVWGIQIAKAVGCHVATTCSGKNVQFCKDLGADEVIDYQSQNVVEALKKGVSESGRKFDLVVDNVGTLPALYWNCHHFTNPRAKYVQVGIEGSLHTVVDLVMRFLWPGFLGGGKRKLQMLTVKGSRKDLEGIGEWMSQGKVRAVQDQVLRMEDAPKAFERLKTHHARGKIVVTVGESVSE